MSSFSSSFSFRLSIESDRKTVSVTVLPMSVLMKIWNSLFGSVRGTAGSNNASVIAVIAGMFVMNGVGRTAVRTNSGSMHPKRILEMSRASSAASGVRSASHCARHHAKSA